MSSSMARLIVRQSSMIRSSIWDDEILYVLFFSSTPLRLYSLWLILRFSAFGS